MDIGMATLKLSSEADRLIDWMIKFKPEQRYVTFPNIFGGCEIRKILPRMATEVQGTWFYRDFEIRFPPLADVTIKRMPTAGTHDNPHRGENIAHLMRDGRAR